MSETFNILGNLKKNFFGMPRELYHRFMYVAPSSDHSLLTLKLPFTIILRKFEVVFLCRK